MDYSLDIILPENSLSQSGLDIRTVLWDGKVYECEPKEYCTDNSIWFNEMSGGPVCEDMLSKTRIARPVLISIDMKRHVTESVISSGELDDFFIRLCKSEFDIYLWKDDEAVDDEYVLTEKDDLSELLKNSLAAEKNIRIIHNKGE